MGAPWRDTAAWARIAQLSEVLGRDLAFLLLDADADTLRQTRNAQPATFALSLVALDFLRERGLQASVVAGHSLGEYTALVAAGALEAGDGMRLVGERSEAMQEAADTNPGTMAAVIGLEADAVSAACAEAGGNAWLANDNAPGQIVIAGTGDGVDAAAAAAKRRGASRVLPLAVGGAFHTPLMSPAQPRLDAALKQAPFAPPSMPIVANVDAEAHDGQEWAELLSAQLCQQVRWRETLLTLAGLGVERFVEVGPGDALSGMVKRTVPGAGRAGTASPEAAGEAASL
jgi:[acyl-carrier-protein] S-malonyltransferase